MMMLSGTGAGFCDENGNYNLASNEDVKLTFERMKKLYDSDVMSSAAEWSADWTPAFDNGEIVSQLIGGWFKTDFKNFSKIYEKQYIETEKALTRQEDMLKKLFYNGVQSGVKLERLKETMQIATLDRDTLLAFVDRIEVYEEKKVSVQFCYQEEMEKMLVLSEFLSSQSEVVKEVI